MEKLLTVQQLSELIQASPRTIYNWVHIGYIPYYKVSGFVRFRAEQIEGWLRKKRRRGRTSMRQIVDLENRVGG